MRADAIRNEVVRMLRQAPFRPFVLSMENGDRVTIGHPENIAFDPEGESPDFYVISGHSGSSGSSMPSPASPQRTRSSISPNEAIQRTRCAGR